MAKSKLLTLTDFTGLLPTLRKRLADALTKEQLDCALPDPTTDLWDFPAVDSKTVAKLSPVVKELTGHRIRPSWIRKGGYESIEAAVQDLIAQIRTHCVVGGAAESTSKPISVILTP
jgi:hypothetical protein